MAIDPRLERRNPLLTTRRGFTLIELMIVLCLIGILASIILPKQRDLSRHAEAAALLERVRVIRTAVTGVDAADAASLSAPVGVVPRALAGSLSADDLAGEGGVRFELSAHANEQWLLLHGATPEQQVLLQSAAALAHREGLIAHWEGALLTIPLNDAAERARPRGAPVTDPSATSAPTSPPTTTTPMANPDPCAGQNPPATCAPAAPQAVTGPPPANHQVGAPYDVFTPPGGDYFDTWRSWGMSSCSEIGQHPELTWDGIGGSDAQLFCETLGYTG